MKEILKRWIMYADNDLKVAQHEIKNEDCVVNAVCFHAQQCVEKYLKAFLIFHDKPIVKTHDIALLLKQCIEIDPDFKKLEEMGVQELTVYSVQSRYPDFFYEITIEDAKEAIRIAQKVKRFVRKKLREKGFKI